VFSFEVLLHLLRWEPYPVTAILREYIVIGMLFEIRNPVVSHSGDVVGRWR
jgi:hypothetical protein